MLLLCNNIHDVLLPRTLQTNHSQPRLTTTLAHSPTQLNQNYNVVRNMKLPTIRLNISFSMKWKKRIQNCNRKSAVKSIAGWRIVSRLKLAPPALLIAVTLWNGLESIFMYDSPELGYQSQRVCKFARAFNSIAFPCWLERQPATLLPSQPSHPRSRASQWHKLIERLQIVAQLQMRF